MGKHPKKRFDLTRPVIQTSMADAMQEAMGNALNRKIAAILRSNPRQSAKPPARDGEVG